MKAPTPGTFPALMLEHMRRAPAEPVTSNDAAALFGFKRKAATVKLSIMVEDGRAVVRKVQGECFYFLNDLMADAYPLAKMEAKAQALKAQTRDKIGQTHCDRLGIPRKADKPKKGRSGTVVIPGVDAPVKLRRDAMQPKGEAVITTATKITRIPSFDHGARFRPEPGFVGAFSRVGIGRDVQTGKGWGA